ncbi:hypothetical protein BDR07DRAFT_441763 [Suillus spraguei]|nr:hypothetical protein BDR07DRAFT_441763 [Suillus spraguei]
MSYSHADFESLLCKHCRMVRRLLSYRTAAPFSVELILLSRLNQPRWFSYPKVTHEENLTAVAILVLCATAEALQRACSEVYLKGGYVQAILDHFTYLHHELSGFSDQHLLGRLLVQLPLDCPRKYGCRGGTRIWHGSAPCFANPLPFLASIVDDATIARLLASLPLGCLCLWMSLLAALKNLAVKISCHLHVVWRSIITHSTIPVPIKSHTMASLAMSANVLFIYLPHGSHALYDIYLTAVFSVILACKSGPSVVNCMSNCQRLTPTQHCACADASTSFS